MTIDDIKSPGYIANGQVLRKEAFRALGIAINRHRATDGAATTGADLKAFFLDCAARCPEAAAVSVKTTTKKESK